MTITDTAKYQLAKFWTQLDIQNNLFHDHEHSAETAKEITTFFDAIVDTVGKSHKNDQYHFPLAPPIPPGI